VTAPAPDGVPFVHPTSLASLAADLAVFTVDATREAMGSTAADALGRDDPVPARRALRGSTAPAGVLARLWLLGAQVTRRELDAAVPRTTSRGLERLGLVRSQGSSPDDGVLAAVDMRPI
jgi:hypothetical protein